MLVRKVNNGGQWGRTILIGGAATASAIVAGSSIGAATSAPAPDVSPSAVISILGEEPNAQARQSASTPVFPEWADLSILGTDGIAPASIRFLGEENGSTHWVGVDNASNICVVTVLDADVFGAACNTPSNVEASGINFGFSGDETKDDSRAIVSVLLPDSATPDSATARRSASPWETVSPNLVVANQADLADGAVYSFPRSEGSGKTIKVHE